MAKQEKTGKKVRKKKPTSKKYKLYKISEIVLLEQKFVLGAGQEFS